MYFMCTSCVNMEEDVGSPMFSRISSAVFYGVSSFMIIVANKLTLTSYRYAKFYFSCIVYFMESSYKSFFYSVVTERGVVENAINATLFNCSMYACQVKLLMNLKKNNNNKTLHSKLSYCCKV